LSCKNTGRKKSPVFPFVFENHNGKKEKAIGVVPIIAKKGTGMKWKKNDRSGLALLGQKEGGRALFR